MFGIDNPDTLLRPWENLKQFSEELYAALRRSGQIHTVQTPPTEPTKQPTPESAGSRRPDTPQPAFIPSSLRARPLPEHDLALQQAAKAPVAEPIRPQAPPSPPAAPQRPFPPPPASSPPPAPKPPRAASEDLRAPDTQPSPRRPVYPPSRPDRTKPAVKPPPSVTPTNFPYYPTGGGAGSYMGKVVSFNSGGAGVNSSSTVLVQLYSDGPNGSADETGPNGEENGRITVGILMFLGSDSIPIGYWLTGITPSSNGASYWAQVPIWS